MGEQRNLTNENVEDLEEKLEEMKKDNPDLEYSFSEQDTEQPDSVDTITLVKELTKQMEYLVGKVDRIFGDYVLIKGYFKDLSELDGAQKDVG